MPENKILNQKNQYKINLNTEAIVIEERFIQDRGDNKHIIARKLKIGNKREWFPENLIQFLKGNG